MVAPTWIHLITRVCGFGRMAWVPSGQLEWQESIYVGCDS